MKLIKLKGIVIKDVNYSDNDKILTILTDECGVITCMSKGCRKSTSSFLTSSQYLVYSEFILYKGTSFYHLNSCSSITTFYNLRTDYDKLNLIFDITKNMKNLIYEETDSKEILSLFLNLLYIIEKDIKDNIFAISVFKIKLLVYLGFTPNTNKCNLCSENLNNNKDIVYYNYVHNNFICNKCILDKKACIKISYIVLTSIWYIIKKDSKNVYNFNIDIKYYNELKTFSDVYLECILNGI